jgi:hypothetical protein
MSTSRTVFVPLFGGLGNQMFQVAHALNVQMKSGFCPIYLDFTSTGRVRRLWELSCFGLDAPSRKWLIDKFVAARVKATIHLPEFARVGCGTLIEEQNIITAERLISASRIFSSPILYGYWQGEMFFSEASTVIKNLFSFPLSRLPDQVRKRSSQTVAVHVRRGDYVADPIARRYHFICDEGWYFNAINHMRSLVSDLEFTIYSDDRMWATKTFCSIPNCLIAPPSYNDEAWVDMARMSAADHFIISNSTYSWWSSYLGEKSNSITVAPRYWFPNKRTEDLPIARAHWKLL